jgi:hypothetical protein
LLCRCCEIVLSLMEVLAEIVSPGDEMETRDAEQSSARNERMFERCKVFPLSADVLIPF